ncbi:MAG TPA: DUF11 domain-containing protein, partial [Anaerolineae bacterium]|nr:DUF11 domain-containing protein [Anaerolineae bacterium]
MFIPRLTRLSLCVLLLVSSLIVPGSWKMDAIGPAPAAAAPLAGPEGFLSGRFDENGGALLTPDGHFILSAGPGLFTDVTWVTVQLGMGGYDTARFAFEMAAWTDENPDLILLEAPLDLVVQFSLPATGITGLGLWHRDEDRWRPAGREVTIEERHGVGVLRARIQKTGTYTIGPNPEPQPTPTPTSSPSPSPSPTPTTVPPTPQPVVLPPPTLIIRADPDRVEPGQVVTYTVMITNVAAFPLKDLILSDSLPTGLLYVPDSARGFTYSARENRLIWRVSELRSGKGRLGRFQVRLQPLAVGTQLHNRVSADGPFLPNSVSAVTAVTILPPAHNEAWVTPAQGGWLRSEDGRIEIHIPPGAVPIRTHFIYAPLPDRALPIGAGSDLQPGSLRFAFSLEAKDEEGRQVQMFEEPLALTYFYTPEARRSGVLVAPSLFYLDEETQTWRDVESVLDRSKGRLYAKLTHFSVYGEGEESYLLERMSSLRGAQPDLFTLSVAYGYDFELPPGAGGLTPRLGLRYSSANHTPDSGHFSYVGYGWELVGADWIYIPPGDAHLDRPVLFLQGRTYTLQHTTPFRDEKTGGSWFAKEDPFLKVEAYDFSQTTAGRWVVHTPDGLQYTFGTDENPRMHYWKLCENTNQTPGKRYVRLPLRSIQDPEGNVVTYTWEGDSGDSPSVCKDRGEPYERFTRTIRLRTIRYNDGKAQVILDYDDREDRPDSFDTVAWSFHTEKKLFQVTVQVKVDGHWETVRTYTLTYNPQDETPAASQKVLNLEEIIESAGAQSLPKREFDYSDSWLEQGKYGAMSAVRNGYGGEVLFQSDHRDGNGSNPHVVISRTEKSGIGNTAGATWIYQGIDWDGSGESEPLAQGFKRVRVTQPDGSVITYFYHTIDTVGGHKIDHRAGQAYRLELCAESSCADEQDLMARTVITWTHTTQDLPISGYETMAEQEKPRFVYAERVDTYRDGEGGSRVQYYYDVGQQGGTQFGNATRIEAYLHVDDSTPYRITERAYYPNTERNIIREVARERVWREAIEGEHCVAETRYYYDHNQYWNVRPPHGMLTQVEAVEEVE